jgi:hypothetical protein
MSTNEVDEYLAHLGSRTAKLGRALHNSMCAAGCDAYVKTIYIGYEISGSMVAALYGRADHIELALALEEDDPCPLLKDASHLTWRTLPVAAEVRTEDDASVALGLIRRACTRVRGGTHSVYRDNDHFVRRNRVRGKSS